MDDLQQVQAYIEAYEWGGPTSALQLFHLKNLSRLIRPGDKVLDIACGPGPLMLELAQMYPETRFIGVDLSETMLNHISEESLRLELTNVETLCEDARLLDSLEEESIDLVISTSALHHLPSETVVSQVFSRMNQLLKKDGGFYLFDFGQLKSEKSRQLCVEEVAKLAPPITAKDYELSLRAAYPVETILKLATEKLPKPFTFSASAFVDFLYFVQTAPRCFPDNKIKTHICNRTETLSNTMKLEHFFLRTLKRTQTVGSH